MLQSHKHGLLLPLSAMWISTSQILIAMVLEGTTGTLDLVGAVEVLAAAAVAVEREDQRRLDRGLRGQMHDRLAFDAVDGELLPTALVATTVKV